MPDIVLEATTVVGVTAPRVKVIAGVVVAFATLPETPLAVVTDTVDTVPFPVISFPPAVLPSPEYTEFLSVS